MEKLAFHKKVKISHANSGIKNGNFMTILSGM